MDKRWYPAAITVALVGCGGTTFEPAAGTGTGGTLAGIDSGTPHASGGRVVAVYGVLANTGGESAAGGMGTESTGGTSATGGKTSTGGTTSAGTYYGPLASGGRSTTGGRSASGGMYGPMPVGGTSVGGANVGGKSNTGGNTMGSAVAYGPLMASGGAGVGGKSQTGGVTSTSAGAATSIDAGTPATGGVGFTTYYGVIADYGPRPSDGGGSSLDLIPATGGAAAATSNGEQTGS